MFAQIGRSAAWSCDWCNWWALNQASTHFAAQTSSVQHIYHNSSSTLKQLQHAIAPLLQGAPSILQDAPLLPGAPKHPPRCTQASSKLHPSILQSPQMCTGHRMPPHPQIPNFQPLYFLCVMLICNPNLESAQQLILRHINYLSLSAWI